MFDILASSLVFSHLFETSFVTMPVKSDHPDLDGDLQLMVASGNGREAIPLCSRVLGKASTVPAA